MSPRVQITVGAELRGTAVMFKALFVFVVLAHDRRRVGHINVTDSPAGQRRPGSSWSRSRGTPRPDTGSATAIRPTERSGVLAPGSSLGDPRGEDRPAGPAAESPVERLIGTSAPGCLDHVVVLNDPQVRCLLHAYLAQYHGARAHLSPDKDDPEPRPVEPHARGRIVETSMLGGLHHRYIRAKKPSRRGRSAALTSPIQGCDTRPRPLLPSHRPGRSSSGCGAPSTRPLLASEPRRARPPTAHGASISTPDG